jgi:hypothetical protein
MPELAVYSELRGLTAGEHSEHDELPLYETISFLGYGPTAIHTPEVPRYGEMARYVFDKLGWDGEGFRVYRVLMQYPPIPTAVVMKHDLPEPPD